MDSRSGCSTVGIAWAGTSPTITTPSRLNASSVRERLGRVAASVSASVAYRRSVLPPGVGSSTNSIVASSVPWPWRRITSFCTFRALAAAMPTSSLRAELVQMSWTAM